jgi:hypothetical protein
MLAAQSLSEQVKRQLISLGWAVNPNVPGYSLADTLKRFQMANSLDVDGEYGPQTEQFLFRSAIPDGTPMERVLITAASQIGIAEVPPGSNKGPQIDLVLKAVGLGSGYPWCAAYVYWCFQQACRQMGRVNPCPKSAGVLNLWSLAGYKESGLKRITAAQAMANPRLIKPGMQFLMKFSPTAGHTGLVESVQGNKLITLEGNSNVAGSRDGVAVTRQTKRTISSINLGFISYQ